jgi:predicted AAA+ superfamily ATPase
MKSRTFWCNRVRQLWNERGIVWLSGVRRSGKTSLCRQISEKSLLNCDLPSVKRQCADPEFFLAQQSSGATLILDEVHRLEDPSLLLKIAADTRPDLRILATGSSTLDATPKFRDSLTDRKRTLHLPPVLWSECMAEFDVHDLDRRLLNGGLPKPLLAGEHDPDFFEDWIDSFYARDIQELFGVRNRTGFLKVLTLSCLRNGGQLDITDLAKESGMSRTTVMAHLDAMEIAHAIIRLPPFHGGGHREVIAQPRIYAFDTGLVAHVRGWEKIRETDRGHLWENLVLDELRAHTSTSTIHYWRDKSRREVDFVVERSGGRVDAIEAKINPDAFDIDCLRAFRELYPCGDNLLVCPFVKEAYFMKKGPFDICVCSSPHCARHCAGWCENAKREDASPNSLLFTV